MRFLRKRMIIGSRKNMIGIMKRTFLKSKRNFKRRKFSKLGLIRRLRSKCFWLIVGPKGRGLIR